MKYVFDPFAKHELVLGGKTLVGNHRSDISCSWPPGLHTSQEGFCPTPTLRFRGWCLATWTFSSLHRCSMGLWSGVWLGHSRTLMCFFLSLSFVVLAVCFGSVSCWNTLPRPISNALAGFNALVLTVHGPVHWPFDAVQFYCPLSRKTSPKHNVSTSMFDGGGCSWGHRQHSSSSKHGELSWCQRAGFWSHLTTTLSLSFPLYHWQTLGRPVHVLSWVGGLCGCCRISILHGVLCYQLFSWWLWSQLPWDHW